MLGCGFLYLFTIFMGFPILLVEGLSTVHENLTHRATKHFLRPVSGRTDYSQMLVQTLRAAGKFRRFRCCIFPHRFFRGRHGGVEKGGGWKTSRMTPLPKRGFGPPLVRYVFHPPLRCQCSVFLYKNQRQSRPEAVLEGSKNFRESAFSGTFSPPIRFAPPHITAQLLWGKVAENPPRKSLAKSPKNSYNRNPGHVLKSGRAKICLPFRN